MSPFKVVFTYLRNFARLLLLASPGLCLRTSTLVTYLLPRKVSGHTGFWFKCLKGLMYIYLLGIVLRMAAFNVYLINDGSVEEYLTIEPYYCVMTLKLHFVNKYTVGIVGLMAVFSFYIDYAFNFLTDYQIIITFSEIILENVRQCSTVVFGPIDGFSLTTRRFWQVVGQLSKGQSCVTFRGRYLKTFPRLSKKLRIHLVLVTIISETFVWAANLFSGIVFTYIWLRQIRVILELVPSSAVLFAIFDLTFMVYGSFNGIRMTLFSLHVIFIYSCLFVGYLRQLRESIWFVIQKTEKAKSKQKGSPILRLLARLSLYQAEHAPIYLFERHLNRQLVSSLMFITVTVNLLVNVVVLNFLLIGRTSTLERTFIVVMTVAQTSCALVGASILISMVAPLYACERMLYRAQGLLDGSQRKGQLNEAKRRMLTAKLGLMSLFETVCTKKKFTFTAGSISKISKKAVFKVG